MKKLIVRILSISFLVLLSVAVSRAQIPPGASPGGGFTGSPHDFSGPIGQTGVSTGGCTFCHTPHRAIQQALLWNHTLPSNRTYSWEAGAKTAGGTEYPAIDPSWNGPSKLCLSCHDGSVAIGDIAWFNKQSWNGASALDLTTHDLDVYNIANATTGSMRGNHPVAFPYPFQQQPNTYNLKQTGAATYVADFAMDPQLNGIRLFNQSGTVITAGAVAGSTGIECTSCHGVHNEVGLVHDEPLLRGTLGGSGTGSGASYICMKCHTR